ncbi:MAG: FGGY-family carbohydrate kinase, partial [Spirochaetales bacterium]
GMDILKAENVKINRLSGHGGYFKTPAAGQRILSAATGVPVSVMETAGEGGPYGMALLASFMLWGNGMGLEDYLDKKVFKDSKTDTVTADSKEIKGFEEYMKNYIKILEIEKHALEIFNA